MNTNQPDTTKSSKELKEQVLNDINKVKEDFEEIKQRMTPGQIIDDAIYYRSGRGDPAQTFAHLKANPVGTTFLTLGTLLLMEDEEHHSFESLARERAVSMKDKVGATRGKIGSAVSDAVQQAKNKFAETKDKVSSTIDARSGEVSGQVSEKLSGKGQELYDYAKNMDPMIYIALGAGLGTITGAALPLTETESQLASSDKMSKFAHELQDALNQSVNILKNEVIGGTTDFKFDLFR